MTPRAPSRFSRAGSRARRRSAALAGAVPAVLASLLGAARPVRAEDTCRPCHSRLLAPHLHDPVVSLRGSVHDLPTLSCADCHGGDPADPTARSHALEKGFVARPSPEQVPGICGSCHSDPNRLGPAGADLPRHQLALYRRSGHGKALARGNTRTATCESCHGAHDLRTGDDPASRVHPKVLATTCGSCHSDPEVMAGTGIEPGQEARWRRSVHGRALMERDNPSSPTCNGCHGSHGGLTELNDVEACGRCHEQQQRSFSRSPHARLFDRLGFASCIDCHGSHEVVEAHANLVGVAQGSTCRRCHVEEQAEVFAVVRRLGESRAEAEEAAQRADEALGEALRAGVAPERVAAVRASLREARGELAEGIHAFDDVAVGAAVSRIERLAASSAGLEAGRDDEGRALLVVASVVAAAALLLGAAGLALRGLGRARRGA